MNHLLIIWILHDYVQSGCGCNDPVNILILLLIMIRYQSWLSFQVSTLRKFFIRKFYGQNAKVVHQLEITPKLFYFVKHFLRTLFFLKQRSFLFLSVFAERRISRSGVIK